MLGILQLQNISQVSISESQEQAHHRKCSESEKKYKTSARIKGFAIWKATRRTQPSYIRIPSTTFWHDYFK